MSTSSSVRLPDFTSGCIEALCTSDVIQLDLTIGSAIEKLEGFDAEIRAELVHWANNHSNEFIKVNLTISIIVEAFK